MRLIATLTIAPTLTLAAAFAWAPLSVIAGLAALVAVLGLAMGALCLFAGRSTTAPTRTIAELAAECNAAAVLVDSMFARGSSNLRTNAATPRALACN